MQGWDSFLPRRFRFSSGTRPPSLTLRLGVGQGCAFRPLDALGSASHPTSRQNKKGHPLVILFILLPERYGNMKRVITFKMEMPLRAKVA